MKASNIQKQIVATLLRERRPLTLNELAKITGISWVTIKKHIPILKALQCVQETEGGKIIINTNLKEQILQTARSTGK